MTDDELSGRARAILDQALSEELALAPDAEHRRRLKRGLLHGAALAGAGGAVTAKAASAPVLALAKSIGVGLLVSGGVLGGAQLLSPQAPIESPPPGARGAAAPRREVTPTPPALPTPSASVEPQTPPPSPPATAAPAAPSALTSAAPSLREELALLGAAQSALRDGDAAGALSLLARYDASFPAGQLTGERLAVEVFAACELGERARATRAATRFLQRDSVSTLAERVKRACPFHPAGEAP